MAVDRRRAGADLRLKRRLEDALGTRLRREDRALGRAFARALLTGGQLDPMDRAPEYTRLLEQHGARVAEAFLGRVSDQLKPALRMTPEERQRVRIFMERLIAARAPAQARVILETTRKDAGRAMDLARQQADADAREGTPGTTADLALTAARILARLLARRAGGITVLETQAVAEAAKQVEVQILVGQDPLSYLELRARVAGPPVKEWVSQGDSRVRPAHIAADSVQVPVEEAFTIGGERLMYPGDVSLGASAGNVVGCRCTAAYDVESVESARQDIVGADAPPPPLKLGTPASAQVPAGTAADLPPPKLPAGLTKRTASNKTVREVEEAWDAMPEGTRRLLAEAGVPVDVVKTGNTAMSAFRGRRTSGSRTQGSSFVYTARVDTSGAKVTEILDRQVVIVSEKNVGAFSPRGILYHETGHAVDLHLGITSDSIGSVRGLSKTHPGLKAAYAADRAELTDPDVAAKLNYFMTRSAEHNMSEVFAESHAFILGAEDERAALLGQHFPRAVEAVREILAEKGLL